MTAVASSDAPTTALRRNRDFLLLQTGQLLSTGGSQIASIAYPLLVLAETGSAAKTGLVGAVQLAARAVFSLPAGLAADRIDRRRVMIGADVVRLLTVAALVAAIAGGQLSFWLIALVALVEASAGSFFQAAQHGALRSVVPAGQLADAINIVTGRQAAVTMSGPAVGGALFGIARALPFAIDAVSYACSSLSLMLMRTPFQERRNPEEASFRSQVGEGFSFLWRQPFIRATAFVFAPLNMAGMALTLTVVVTAKDEGLSGTVVGLLVASFGAGVLVGSLISPFVRRVLPSRAVLVLELWMWPVPLAYVVWPSVWVLAASMLPAALAIPSTDSVVYAFQLAVTPDRLVGRVNSVFSLLVLAFSPLGPLLAGVLLEAWNARATVALFAGCALVVAIAGTLSRALRTADLSILRSSAADASALPGR